MYNIENLSNYIIYKSKKLGHPITNARLQCILYFLQVKFVADKDRLCFAENIEASGFGAVIPESYLLFKGNGERFLSVPKKVIPFLEREDKETLDEMLVFLGEYSTAFLQETIQNQTPWKKARDRRDQVITVESLREYFKN